MCFNLITYMEPQNALFCFNRSTTMEQLEEDENMSRFFKVMLKVFLITVGIFRTEFKKISRLYYLFYALVTSISMFGSVLPILINKDAKIKLESIFTVVPQATDLLMFMYFHYKSDNVMKVIANLTKGHSNSLRVLKMTEKFFKIKFLTCFVVHSTWASLFFVTTIIYLLSNKPISAKSLMIPYWFSCGDADADTFLKKFCWNVDSPGELWLANICMTTGAFLEYTVYCTSPIFYSILIANIWKHLNVLKSDMRTMVAKMRRNGQRVDKITRTTGKYREEIKSEFREIIKYQQFLRRYCREITDIMSGYVMIFLIEFVGTVIFLLFTIIMEADSNEKIIIIKSTILGISGLSGFVMNCFYAQIVADINRIILKELSDIPWYEQSIEFRKNYATCLALNEKPLYVTAVGMYTLNYEFSMNCLKTVYSVLNMVLLHYRRT